MNEVSPEIYQVNCQQRMLEYLPDYYQTSRVMKTILEQQGKEIDLLITAMVEVFKQFFVSTTTWRIDRWETELGLPVQPAQPLGERRNRIISKLRGFGTATIYLVKKVAESYDHGAIDIIQDHQFYRIFVSFIDTMGTPTNLEDIKKAVRDVLPAHLLVEFIFNYFVWNELDTEEWTWDELDGLEITWDKIICYQ